MSAIPDWCWIVCLGLLGLLVGSFANVVIWRVPRGESIVSPGSHCPRCEKPIVWYDNIPVVSWLALRGRCRICGAPIAIRYPFVEATSGGLFVAAGLLFDLPVQALFGAAFFWLLLVLSVIDTDTMRLPNPLVGVLAAVGLAGAIVGQASAARLTPLVGVAASGWLSSPLVSGFFGCALGAGLSGGIAAAYGAVRGKAGLGMGDVKLLGAMGFFLGPYVLLSLFFGSLIGIVAGTVGQRGKRGLADRKIPFGPWLAAGGVLAATIGPPLAEWYFRVIGIA